ncbi:MAG: MPN551 family DNA-binding protein [Mycoplasma sp.]
MPFTKIKDIDFKVDGNRIKLSKEFIENNKSKFKKITGSRFASILGKSEYNSPVKVWSMMVGIYNEPMDPTLAKVGNTIEPKVHKFVCDELNMNFKQYNPFEIKWDAFKENPIFGGIPDGEPIDANGNFLYPNAPMLEIKTTSIDSFVYKFNKNTLTMQKDVLGNPIVKSIGQKKAKWFDDDGEIIISNEYKYQLGLYCYLRNVKKGIFAVCFLETTDYVNPENCNVNERDVRLVNFELDTEEFNQAISYSEKWYKKYIENGISPEFSAKDWEWFNNEFK